MNIPALQLAAAGRHQGLDRRRVGDVFTTVGFGGSGENMGGFARRKHEKENSAGFGWWGRVGWHAQVELSRVFFTLFGTKLSAAVVDGLAEQNLGLILGLDEGDPKLPCDRGFSARRGVGQHVDLGLHDDVAHDAEFVSRANAMP